MKQRFEKDQYVRYMGRIFVYLYRTYGGTDHLRKKVEFLSDEARAALRAIPGYKDGNGRYYYFYVPPEFVHPIDDPKTNSEAVYLLDKE